MRLSDFYTIEGDMMTKTKRIVSLLLSLTVVLSAVFCFDFNAFADQIRYFERGVLTDGTNTAYYLIDKDERVLYLTGDGINPGRSPDYPNAASGPFAGRTDVTRICIEEDVERIGDYTFANMTSVDTLEIQSNLLTDSSMSTKAMSGCTGLRSIQGDSTLLSTDVLVEIVKGAVNAFTGNWLSLAMNVINIGKEGFTSDNNLENEVIAALVDDYINTGETIYFGDIADAQEGYNERMANPCYENKQFNHLYSSSVTQPTCDENGATTYVCSRCGDTYSEPIPATGHEYEESILYEPTCTKKGVKEYCCTKCGDVKLTPITALGHTPENVDAVAPTCATTGLTAGVRCSVCGDMLTPQETVATLPHTYSYEYNAQSDEYTGVCDVCQHRTNQFDNDLSALVSAVDFAESLNSDDYTEASYNAMYDSIVKYINLTDSDYLAYPQFAVDEKTTEILTRISELVPYLDLSVSYGTGGSAQIQYDNETIAAPRRISVSFGDSVTVSASVENGYRFEGWYETVSQRYLSNDINYTFTLTSNTSLKAIFIPVSTATLTFTNDTGQIVEQVTKSTQEWYDINSIDDLLPAVPYKYGHTNGRWDYSISQLMSRLRGGYDCTVEPYYTSLNVELPEQPVSPDGVTPALTLSYDLVQKEDESYAGSFIMAADIPNEASVVEIGTVFYRDKAADFDPTQFSLTINNKNLVSKYEGVEDSGIYITNINGLTAKYNWAAKGYVTYSNGDGTLVTAYTNQINIVNRDAV